MLLRPEEQTVCMDAIAKILKEQNEPIRKGELINILLERRIMTPSIACIVLSHMVTRRQVIKRKKQGKLLLRLAKRKDC